MTVKLKVDGSWKNVTSIKLKVSGAWKNVTQAKLKVSGAWKTIFLSSAVSEPQSTVTISQSTDSTTKLVTLTGTNKYWSPTPSSLTYQFQWYNGSFWTTINSGNITNPSAGSTNTKTYIVQNSESNILPNMENLYRFIVTSVYNGVSNASTSSTTSIQTPRNISDLSASTISSSAIALSWSASLYANNYKIYYKSTGDYAYAGISSSTSYTVSGLQGNTAYTFKIIPITGNGSYAGYTGNESNEASATTTSAPAIIDGPFTFVTSSTITVTFAASNTQSWKINRFGGVEIGSGNGSSGSGYDSGLTPSTNYFYQITLWSGLNQTGTVAYAFIDATTDANPAPSNTIAPSISPTTGTLGETVFTCSVGTWSGSSITYTYNWQYFDTGGYTATGYTDSTYTPPYPFPDSTWLYSIRCVVTATNSGGSASANSNSASLYNPVLTPGTPTSLSATTDRTDGINLTFSGSARAASYDIWYSVIASGTPSDSNTPDFPGVSSPYLWTSATADANRWFWVRGKNEYGTSSWYPSGDGVLGKKLSPVAPPPPPIIIAEPPIIIAEPPYFPYFPSFACIDQNTPILVSALNRVFTYKTAKELVLGDKIVSAKWNGLVSEKEADPLLWSSDRMDEFEFVESYITGIKESYKDVTVVFNDDMSGRFSLEHTMLINRGGINMFASSGSVEVGDILYKNINGEKVEYRVDSIRLIDENRLVYQFDAGPHDIIIAGDLITHNIKANF